MCIQNIRLLDLNIGNLAYSSLWTVCFAFPELLIRSETCEIVNTILASHHNILTIEYLQQLSEYLETQKVVKLDTKVDMTQLIGTAETYASAGVPSAVIQRFLEPILHLLNNSEPIMTSIIFRIVSRAVRDGLTHPISCLTGIAIMEASEDAYIRRDALTLHKTLAERYASFIHTRYSDCIIAVYENKAQSTNSEPLGYRKDTNGDFTSIIDPLYSVVPEKRGRHQDFVRTVVKLLLDSMDLKLIKFVAQGIATLYLNCSDDANEFSHELSKSASLAADSFKVYVEDFENGTTIGKNTEESIRKYVILMQLHSIMRQRYKQNILRVQAGRLDLELLNPNQNLKELILLVIIFNQFDSMLEDLGAVEDDFVESSTQRKTKRQRQSSK